MPRYELMYILASTVSDDQVGQIANNITKFVVDYGGTDIQETQLGKKKLAYPIKKTRNGFYGLVNFSMDTKKINELDAKIRTQDSTVIRYILVNLDEHLARLEKDKVAQANLSRPQTAEGETTEPVMSEAVAPAAPATPEPVAVEATEEAEEVEQKPKRGRKPKAVIDEVDLDKKIEEALNENLGE